MELDLIGEAWEDIKPHVEDDLRTGAFEMNIELTPEEIAYDEQWEKDREDPALRWEMEQGTYRNAYSQYNDTARLRQAWNELQSVPSYVEQQAREFTASEMQK
jgi:hypothetical protein